MTGVDCLRMLPRTLLLGTAMALGLAAGRADAQRSGLAAPDAGAPRRVHAGSDREVIDDLDLLTNLELLRDLEMCAPTDGGAPP